MATIKFGDIQEIQLPREKQPAYSSGSRFGFFENKEKFFLYVIKAAEDKIIDHLNQTPRVESGGVIIGHPFLDINEPSKIFTVVTDSLPIKSVNSSIGHYTVSPEDISCARRLIPDGLVAVGWYHSHPGHGIFLSGADMNIVRGIYNLSWQVSFVVDTLRGLKGFFHGDKGERIENVHYLNHKPLIIEAIARYNCAIAAKKEEGDVSVLEHFKNWIQKNAMGELAHWQKIGVYQDVTLDKSSFSSMLETEWDKEFKKAIIYYNSGKLQVAKIIFEQLQQQRNSVEVLDYLDKINSRYRNGF